MNKKNIMNAFFYLLLAVVLLGSLLVLGWASNRGLDITDECNGLLHLQKSKIMDYISFQVVQNYFFSFIEQSVFGLRIERLALTVLCSLLFSFSSHFFLNYSALKISGQKFSFPLVALLFSGFLLSYAFSPQTPSYNTFSLFFISLATAIFLIDITKHQKKWIVALFYIFIGACCAALFWIKMPNAILIPLAFIVFYFIYQYSTISNMALLMRHVFYRFFFAGFGYLLVQAMFCGGMQSAIQQQGEMIAFIVQLKGYDNSTLWHIYFQSLTAIGSWMLQLKTVFFGFNLVAMIYYAHQKQHRLFTLFCGLEMATVLYYKIYQGGEANKFNQSMYYLLLVVIIGTATLLIKKNRIGTFVFFIRRAFRFYKPELLHHQTKLSFCEQKVPNLKLVGYNRRTYFYFFLFMIPLIGSIGTNNMLHVQVIFYMPFWFLIIYCIAEEIFSDFFKKSIYLLIVLLACSQSINAVLYHPYRIAGSLFEQNQKLNFPIPNDHSKNQSLLVSQEFKTTFLQIDAALKNNHFTNNDYLFTYNDVVGLAYVGNYNYLSIAALWHHFFDENSIYYELSEFKKRNKKGDLFLMLDNRHFFTESFKLKLMDIGIDFDSDYRNVGEFPIHFTNDDHSVSLFVPNR